MDLIPALSELGGLSAQQLADRVESTLLRRPTPEVILGLLRALIAHVEAGAPSRHTLSAAATLLAQIITHQLEREPWLAVGTRTLMNLEFDALAPHTLEPYALEQRLQALGALRQELELDAPVRRPEGREAPRFDVAADAATLRGRLIDAMEAAARPLVEAQPQQEPRRWLAQREAVALQHALDTRAAYAALRQRVALARQEYSPRAQLLGVWQAIEQVLGGPLGPHLYGQDRASLEAMRGDLMTRLEASARLTHLVASDVSCALDVLMEQLRGVNRRRVLREHDRARVTRALTQLERDQAPALESLGPLLEPLRGVDELLDAWLERRVTLEGMALWRLLMRLLHGEPDAGVRSALATRLRA